MTRNMGKNRLDKVQRDTVRTLIKSRRKAEKEAMDHYMDDERRYVYAVCDDCLFHENEEHIKLTCTPQLRRFGKALDHLREVLINSNGVINAHYVNITVRRDGKGIVFSADFLKDLVTEA